MAEASDNSRSSDASRPANKAADVRSDLSSASNAQACVEKSTHRSQSYFVKYGEPLNYPVDAAAWAIGIGRSTLWDMIKRGLVQTVKIGRRRLIPREEIHRIRRGC